MHLYYIYSKESPPRRHILLNQSVATTTTTTPSSSSSSFFNIAHSYTITTILLALCCITILLLGRHSIIVPYLTATTNTNTDTNTVQVPVPVVFVTSWMVVSPRIVAIRRRTSSYYIPKQHHPFQALLLNTKCIIPLIKTKDCCPHNRIGFQMSSSSRTALFSSSSSSSSTSTSTSNTESYLQVLSKAVSDALDTTVELEMSTGGGSAGGSGATTFVVRDKLHPSQKKYFVKSSTNTEQNQLMIYGEYCSVEAIYQTNTIRVPKPIAYGNYLPGSRTFIIFEYLHFAPSTSSQQQYMLGQQVAKLHLESAIPKTDSSSSSSQNQQQLYGFHVNNTIGATFQPNLPYYNSWTEFFINHRLDYMLSLTHNVGMSTTDIDTLRSKVRTILDAHESNVQPSLVHGDLWGGNKGFCYNTDDNNDTTEDNRIIVPCIFDPASYYGDREVDIAMTYVFGGFSNDFYTGYNDVFPLAKGHESRRIIYNLYHILNHDVLFGGGYRNQARNMIYEILRM